MNTATAIIGSPDTDSRRRIEAVYEKLEGIDPDDLRDALLAITEGAPIHQFTRDLPDAGTELLPGEDGAVTVEELPDFERIVGINNQLPVAFLQEGVIVQKAVARVQLRESVAGLPAGSGWGSGSLISNSLLLTNNHVIPDVAFAKKVRAEFNYQLDHLGSAQPSDAYELDPDAFFRTNAALDYTVVRVRSKSTLVVSDQIDLGRVIKPRAPMDEDTRSGDRIDVSDRISDRLIDRGDIVFPFRRSPGSVWGHLRLPASGVSYAVGQFLNVIGHPSGRRKEVALQENTVTGIFPNVVRYTADTEPGSSGSPVFTNGWDLVALHHAGGDQAANGTWLNNEGMRIDRIVADLQANVPASIRTELGI